MAGCCGGYCGSRVKVGTCCISPRTWPGSWLPLFRRKLFVSLKRQMRRPFACVSAVTWCYWKPGFGPTSSLQWEHVLLTKYCIVQSSRGAEHSHSEETMDR